MVVTGVGPHLPVAACGRCASVAEEAGLPRTGVWLPACATAAAAAPLPEDPGPPVGHRPLRSP